MEVCAHIVVKGLVQGVGFRYFAASRARQFELKGFVKNMPSGDVEIRAEGERQAIEIFLREIKVGPRSAQVTDVEIEWHKPNHSYSGFFIE